MTRQPVLARRAEQLLGTAVVATAPVAGGDISTATKLRLSNGTTALMKTLSGAPADFFPSEAAGLRWLGEVPGGVRVPEVLAVEPDCLIIAWVETGRGGSEDAADLGRRLATTHRAGAASYGAGPADRPGGPGADGYIGRLPLPNATAPTWAEFYATRRLLPYAKLAHDRGALTSTESKAIDTVVGKLSRLLPEEAPSRLHGDLWNGNVLWGQEGRVTLIDPAAYGGHREVDLAMLALFGLPHLPRMTEAYEEVSPLADGWEDRLGLHQLFPLLVHACLNGRGYGARAAAMAARYS